MLSLYQISVVGNRLVKHAILFSTMEESMNTIALILALCTAAAFGSEASTTKRSFWLVMLGGFTVLNAATVLIHIN